MTVGWKKTHALPIGIDLGSASLKMAQLRAAPLGSLSLVAAGRRNVPPGDEKAPDKRARFAAEAIRQLMSDLPFKGRRCILSLPAEVTFIQHIKMAKMSSEQLTGALQWELQGKLPYDPSRAIIRHVVAGEIYSDSEVKQEVIVLAANRAIIESHLNLLHRSKLDCVGINLQPCAIVECFARLFRREEDTAKATLFVDVGSASTQVVILNGGRMVFAKNLFVAGRQFDQAVAEGLKVRLEEAQRRRRDWAAGKPVDGSAQFAGFLNDPIRTLAAELTSCLRYYESVFPNRPVDRAVFLGGQAHDKQLCQTLAQRLSMPARIGDPLANIAHRDQADGDPRSAESGPDWAVAVGLSLGALVTKANARQPKEAVAL